MVPCHFRFAVLVEVGFAALLVSCGSSVGGDEVDEERLAPDEEQASVDDGGNGDGDGAAMGDSGGDVGDDSGDAGSGGTTAVSLNVVSYFGGSSSVELVGDMGRDAAVDQHGNWYVTGGIDRFTGGVFAGPNGTKIGPLGDEDVFVLSFGPDGAMRYATVIGSTGYDRAYAIEVDAAGCAYVAGRASNTFPTTTGALQPTFGGDDAPNGAYGANDGFIFKLAADGSLVWSTYFGGPGRDFIRDIDLDASGNIYVAVASIRGAHPHIQAGSGSFRDTQPSPDYNHALIKLDPTGTSVIWGGYLGGTGDEASPPSVQVTSQGDAFMIWASISTDLPISANAFQPSLAGQADVVLARITRDGSALAYMTYLGTTGDEFVETHQVAVNDDAEAVVMFQASASFPVPATAFQSVRANSADILLARISADGSTLVGATYLGGGGFDLGEGIDMDQSGNVYLTGTTTSSDFPTTSDALSRSSKGANEALAVVMAPNLDHLVYGTLIGGAGDDSGRGMAVGPHGELVGVGQTKSTDLPVANALQSSYGAGRQDAMFFRVNR